MQNLKIIDTNKGKGVITTVDVPKDSFVLEFKGDIFNKENIKHDPSYILQIGKDKFLGPSGDTDDYINHSCNPNCGLRIVGSRAFLIALHVIKAGTEITFDYSTSSTDSMDEWKMACLCGSINCRKEISGYHYLNDGVKKRYEDIGVIPKYLRGST